jgi:ABC-type uncharacterized transport system permease subunit
MVELLVWPTVVAYGEAALVYAGELRGSRRYETLGIWGVRVGWIAQTTLLVSQALSADGFPWGTWAGALNLLSWLVVSGYLVWGCRPRYRLVGLGLMPIAACLVVLAWAGGGTALDADGDGWALATHVGLMLAGLASFTVAAAMAGLYTLEERRLKRRDTGVLRLRLPSLEALDRLAARVVIAGLALLTAGIAVGVVWLDVDGLDAAMTAAVMVWMLYALALVLRWEAGVRGHRFAQLLLAGLLLVAAVLPVTHFAT